MAEEAGEVTSCPQCGQEVKQKSMIPVLAPGGGIRHLCRSCAQAGALPDHGDRPATDEAANTEPVAEPT